MTSQVLSLSIKHIKQRAMGPEGTSVSSVFFIIALTWLRPKSSPQCYRNYVNSHPAWISYLEQCLHRKDSVGLTFKGSMFRPNAFFHGSRLQLKTLKWTADLLILLMYDSNTDISL